MPTISHHDLRQQILAEAVERHLVLAASAARSAGRGSRSRRWKRRLLLLGHTTALAVAVSLAGSAAPTGSAVPTASRQAADSLALPSASSAAGESAIPAPSAPQPRRPGSPMVVLDAGHGGDSHGAEVSSGLMEKDINLDVGLRLRTLLESRGYEVLMTRLDDRDLPLEERVALANERGADVFLSIHVNWMTRPDIRAIETFFRSDVPAGSDSTVPEAVAGSRLLAEAVQSELLRYLRSLNPNIRDRGVKSAPLAVLKQASMPAILTEVSCLSHEDDARLLRRASYRQYLAEALSAGIERYVESQRTGERDA